MSDYLFRVFAGLHFTDTSQDMEALHNAMSQLAPGTLNTDDLQNSSASGLVGQTATSNEGTAGFGMRPVAPPRSGRTGE